MAKAIEQLASGTVIGGNDLEELGHTTEEFELRFLSRRQPPDRWVIDLGRDDDALLPPQAYFTIPNPEDRLYIPGEYVPLFVEAGWRRG
jgi:hypothetical protein